MMMVEGVEDRNLKLTLDDIDLSLLRLTSPRPYDYSHSSSADEITPPLKRASPVSDESDQSKRRKLSPQNPIFITSPLLFTSPETQSSSIRDPTRYTNLTSPVSEKRETTPSASDTEKQQEEVEEEEDCGGGMRIERSGDGFVIRLKCRCRQAFRVLFSDHHLYFKPL